jgi:MoaA/NifB/PqqE/SkfB family radical SAM enzyme
METTAVEALTEMPFLRNVGLIVTYQCQVTCPHCILQSGPQRKERVRRDDALDWIGQLARYRDGMVWVLALTGGEPFNNLPLLRELSESASDQGLLVSAVTNAYWASTLEKAVQVLESLPSLRVLQISTDVYHQLSIPFERVVNAVKAARACQIPYTIAVCTENEHDSGYLAVMEQLTALVDRSLIYTSITFPVGRAAETVDRTHYAASAGPPLSACTAGSAPIILPDGRVLACIGPLIQLKTPYPLLLGNLHEESLAVIFDRAETNPILHAIRVWGPRVLIKMAAEAGLSEFLPKVYFGNSVCNACYDLMAVPQIVAFCEKLSQDPAFQRKVAYARVYYMKEPEMVSFLGLKG